MKTLVFQTSENWSATALRIVLGIILFTHGAGAMLGWFGGYGFAATTAFLQQGYGLPWFVAVFVICLQFFGSIMLMTGMATRVAALGVFGMFIGMALTHIQYGLHMNWSGQNTGEGYEFHLLVLSMCVALILHGGGALSLDRILIKAKS